MKGNKNKIIETTETEPIIFLNNFYLSIYLHKNIGNDWDKNE